MNGDPIETPQPKFAPKLLEPIAVALSSRELIYSMVMQGYNQSGKVTCPICEKEFVLLFDEQDVPTGRAPISRRYVKAFRYFLERVEQDHADGHQGDLLTKG